MLLAKQGTVLVVIIKVITSNHILPGKQNEIKS